MRFFATLLFIICISNGLSTKAFSQQRWNPNNPPNTYRTKGNPHYWKNRPPDAAYWQQDVYYRINATIDETTDIITGEQTLRYWNNSPDTLYYAFFHLYQQGFVKAGPLEDLNLNNNVKQRFGKYESQGLGTVVDKWLVNGDSVRVDQDFSVVKVYLPKSLMPGDSVDFQISFKTYFDNGTQRRRMKKFDSWGHTHYDGVLWYPRISVYDRKMGWDTHQHIGKEFYGDFGTFEVSLDFASNYIVEGTGLLQNQREVMPDSLRQKLDIKNFLSKPWNSPPSTIIPYVKGQRKQWKYYAENVHDFAFTADPTYRIGEAEWNGIKAIALVQEPHAVGWHNAALFAARCIQVYSQDFGQYAWNKIIVADARDGMEYNMITLDGGFTPAYYDLLAHEIGHMWFYGMVGSNETYRAFLDEGFAQFIDSWALPKITGPHVPQVGLNRYQKKFTDKKLWIDEEIYRGYLHDAIRYEDVRINQHSDAFNGALHHGGGYRHVYFKAATMLWNLQYVLGDSLFQAAFRNYFDQWKFCHPYDEDFRASIIQFTKTDLNWFFDQWIDSDKRIDYKVKNVKRKKDNNYEINLERLGRMQMPLDVMVVNRENDTSYVHIPNTWFVKNVDSAWSVAPKWYGWDNINKTYKLKLESEQKIRNVVIDPTHRLADINLVNNSLQHPVKWKFDSQVSSLPDRYNYTVKWRPDVWYNSIDGIKTGLHFNGGYMKYKHLFHVTAWLNTGLISQYRDIYPFNDTPGAIIRTSPQNDIHRFSINASYSNPLNVFNLKAGHTLKAHWLDGLVGGSYRWDVALNEKTSINVGVRSMYRPDFDSELYPLFQPDTITDAHVWESQLFNNTLRVGLNRKYNYIRGNGDMNLNFVSSTILSDYNYAYANFVVTNYNRLGKFDVNTRFFIQYSDDRLPGESALYAAGANPEEMFENKYTRSHGIVPDEWVRFGNITNHFQHGGGLNLRGYNGYVMVEQQGNDLNNYFIYQSNSGASGSIEIEFDRLVKFAPGFLSVFKLDPYIFADAGVIGYDNNAGEKRISYPRVDAGVGAALTIKRFWVLDEVKPLTVRFDVPLFLNRPPFAEEEFVKFRWLVGVNRSL